MHSLLRMFPPGVLALLVFSKAATAELPRLLLPDANSDDELRHLLAALTG